MLFVREFTIRKFERGLLYKNGDFVRFLAPGAYRFVDPNRRYEIERFDLSRPAFEHRLANFLTRWYPDEIDALFVRVTTGPSQIAVIFEDGRPTEVLEPERRALYWKGVVRVTAQLFDLGSDLAAPPRLAAGFGACGRPAVQRALLVRAVPETHVGLLYVDGALRAALPPGRHAFWALGPRVAIELVDLRVATLAPSLCTAPTQDRRALRLTFDASWRIADAAQAARTTENPAELLYKEIDRALAAAVAALPLEACLDSRRELERAALADAGNVLTAAGIELLGVAIRDCALASPFAQLVGKAGPPALYAGPDADLEDLVRLRI